MSRNVIVIGGVALGPKAASRLKRLDPTANVTMIDENINISFGGCGIPYYVSGEINSLDALRSTTYGTVRTPEYFEHKGVHTLNQTRVTAIDRAAKTVTAKNLVTGEEKALPYDRLIIATGSTPKVPPVEGRDLKNVGGANNLEDADALRKACASGSVQNAVVIGAGFIGMEIAVALADMWDIKTSVVEFMPQAMPGVMSASLSDMVRHDLEEHNVDVYTGEKVQRLEGENGVVARVVTDKRTLDADLVIFATGFAPNTALARAAGLDLEGRTRRDPRQRIHADLRSRHLCGRRLRGHSEPHHRQALRAGARLPRQPAGPRHRHQRRQRRRQGGRLPRRRGHVVRENLQDVRVRHGPDHRTCQSFRVRRHFRQPRTARPRPFLP